MVLHPLKKHFHSMFPADVFAAFSQAFHIRYFNIRLAGVVAVIVVPGPFVFSLLVLIDGDSIPGPQRVLTSF